MTTMVKSPGRRWSRYDEHPRNWGKSEKDKVSDASAQEYFDALPGTPAEVATKLGISLRQAERSLNTLGRMHCVRRDGERFVRVMAS